MSCHLEGQPSWTSRWGFALAAMSSAVGLANVWRFPFLVGQYGGAAFLIVYLLCLALAGVPLFVLEVLIGRESRRGPAEAMQQLCPARLWKGLGWLITVTAFLVSSYYAVVAGWVMGYWAQSLGGGLAHLQNAQQAQLHFESNLISWEFAALWPTLFLTSSVALVARGVQGGLERASKVLMPLLFLLLIVLVGWSICSLNAAPVAKAILRLDWSRLGSEGVLAALGQAFFTLSLGQGTMIAYGSYLKRSDRIASLALPVVLADTLVSLLSTWLIFAICFQAKVPLDAGPGLVFQTLPLLFNALPLGSILSALFFTLLLIATLTSEMSVIEPVVSSLSPGRGRSRALLGASLLMLLVILPAAFSYRGAALGCWSQPNLLRWLDTLCTRLLIPLSGAMTLLFLHRGWTLRAALKALRMSEIDSRESSGTGRAPCHAPCHSHWVVAYFSFCFKWASPLLITLVFLHSLFGGE